MIEDSIWSYADDNALLLRNLWVSFGKVLACLKVIGKASALWVNVSKCVCVPLWNCDIGEFQEQMLEVFPQAIGFLVASFAKYLGFLVGPGALSLEWEKVEKGITETSKLVMSLGLPKLHAFQLFNMLAMSKIAFPAQLRRPSDRVLNIVRDAQKAIVAADCNGLPNT